MSAEIKFKFEGRDEVLKIIDSGGSIVSLLAKESSVCPLIGTEIKLVKELGKGAYGAVFLIKIPNMGSKKYVVKKIKMNAKKVAFRTNKPIPLKEIAEELREKNLISKEVFIELNGGDPDRMIKDEERIIIPWYARLCKNILKQFFKRFDEYSMTLINPVSYLCEKNTYSEYVIGLLVANLYRKGISINFIDVFGFATCTKRINLKTSQYIFMEKIDAQLLNFVGRTEKLSEYSSYMSSLYIQTLAAIATYQHYYQISHNDLHLGNLFIEYVDKDTEFNGKKIIDADWYHYSIDGNDLYIPATNAIIKIGDFGLSIKWKEPVVGDMKILMGEYGEVVPNWYTPIYDAVHVSGEFYSLNTDNKFIREIYAKMLNMNESDIEWQMNALNAVLDEKEKPSTIRDLEILKYVEHNLRPKVILEDDLKFGLTSPYDILKDKELMKDYITKPKGKIITFGTLP